MDFQLAEEQTMFRQAVRSFAETELKPLTAEIDQAAAFPVELIPKMAAIDLFGMAIPEDYGGADVDSVSTAIAIEEIGRVCGSTGLSLSAHTGLGCFPIARWGTPEQKRRWLPMLASGESLGALCLTEPGAGSDLKAVQTRAVKQGDEWVINGTKAWITNPSMALVETDRAGVTVHSKEEKMGVRGSPTQQVSFDDVRVPLDNLLGVEGQGLRQTLETLDGGRIGIGALSLGIAQGAFEEAIAYAKERTAFGQSIAEFQAIQWMLADGGMEIEAARLLVYRAAWLKDHCLPARPGNG